MSPFLPPGNHHLPNMCVSPGRSVMYRRSPSISSICVVILQCVSRRFIMLLSTLNLLVKSCLLFSRHRLAASYLHHDLLPISFACSFIAPSVREPSSLLLFLCTASSIAVPGMGQPKFPFGVIYFFSREESEVLKHIIVAHFCLSTRSSGPEKQYLVSSGPRASLVLLRSPY